MRSDLRLCASLLAPVLLLTACEIEKAAVPKTTPQIAMHAILSATAPEQVVILERTRTGRAPSWALGDPLNTDVLAESDAILELTTPDGQTLRAREDYTDPNNTNGRRGIYRFALPGTALMRGSEYVLRVHTVGGEQLSATTRVPEGVSAATPSALLFHRERDTLVVEWVATAGARAYLVRIDSPFGPLAFFTDSTHVRLTGELRNLDVTQLPHLFLPGFGQSVTVSAVDSNFYDWYRTHNNRVSGVGLINRVAGGIGVFGSVVRLRFDSLDVVAPQDYPGTGTYVFDGTPEERFLTPNLSITIYLESRSARSDQPDAVSGRYGRRPFIGMRGCVTCGMLGTMKDGHVELAMLTDWFANDTADVFMGFIRGNAIEGFYVRSGDRARYVKQP